MHKYVRKFFSFLLIRTANDSFLEFEKSNPSNPNLYTLNIEMNAEPISTENQSKYALFRVSFLGRIDLIIPVFTCYRRHIFTTIAHHSSPSAQVTGRPQSFPTAQDIFDIDNDHANIMNDAKINYAEQEIIFKKLEKRNVSV